MKKNNKTFENLFVLDLANNHQGLLSHGKSIINSATKVVKKYQINAAIKFQMRDLDTFIHPNHKQNSSNKMVNRFSTTRLSLDDFANLKELVKKNKLQTMCTPFDEKSLKQVLDLNFDIIKIASCSALDWPLLEEVSKSGKPIIISTGGIKIDDIDLIVSFFEHKSAEFSLMHCVSIYPTPAKDCNLNQIQILKERYPDLSIGWSTHESPDELFAVGTAFAKGATMFERHIGLETSKIKLNDYSSNPNQLSKWFSAFNHTQDLLGNKNTKNIKKEETDSLNSLKRGVFARKDLKKGAILSKDDIFFAIPFNKGQLTSGEFIEGVITKKKLIQNESITNKLLIFPKTKTTQLIKSNIHKVKNLLNYSRVILNSDFQIEFSHHYGIENFPKVGATIINCINRAYCKKIVIQTAGQSHPFHYHKKKEETFQIIWGELKVKLDKKIKKLYPGDILLVQTGVWHSFSTKEGCVFEEISTTHFNDDSFYNDPVIKSKSRSERKTIVENWGRFQLK